MTLERIEHKVFASEAPLEEMGQFGSALATTKLNTKDVAEIQALPAYAKGWGSAIISENNYPAMEEMNGVLNVMSYHTGYLYQEGIPVYSASQTYSATSWVKDLVGKDIYKSKKDNNIGNDLNDSEWFERVDFGGNSLKTNQIANCLLEVPQNIKLELVDGVLTLKAGSKVIVPNGVGVFEELTISNDLTLGKIGTATLSSKLYVKADGSALVQWVGEASGSTAPDSGTVLGFYNTADNTCKLYNADGTVAHTVSFPIANVHRTSGSWDKIEQVFNGFGYVGSHLWVDKGVKGLIPNGFNSDGTLNNIEFTTPNVIVSSRVLTQKSIPVWYQDNNTISFSTGWSYIESTNKVTAINDGVTTRPFCQIATVDMASGVISNLRVKQPFRAVDYNDFNKSINTLSKAYITETYVSGTSWYRVWSDGWCEQGGRTPAQESTDYVVTLLKAFSNTDYNVMVTDHWPNAPERGWGNAHTYTTTSFKVVQTSNGVDWRACGYIS